MAGVATSIQNPEGEVLWAPNDFGTYSIEKIQVISKILQDAMKEMVITVKSDESMDGSSYYTKEESNNYFLRKTDYESIAENTINRIIQNDIDTNVLLSVSTFNQMINAVDFLARICFDLTYNQLKAAGAELTFVPFHTTINNLSARITAFDTNLDQLLNTVYQRNPDNTINYSAVNFVTRDDINGYITAGDIRDLRGQYATLLENNNALSSGKADKATTLAGYGITDAYTRDGADAAFAAKATTLAGYGITDAYTKTEVGNSFAAKATSLSGYGITDAYTKSEVDLILQAMENRISALENSSSGSGGSGGTGGTTPGTGT